MIHRRNLVISSVLALLLPALAAAQTALQAPSGSSAWWAADVADAICVSDREGERRSCWPQSVGRLTDLRETTRGWIGAGEVSSAGYRDLFLVHDEGRGVEFLTPPTAGEVPRGRPVLLSDDSQLLGLVWLEGAAQAEFVVRAAQWLGDDWGEAVTVSPAGPGSQVAPTATVLDDGRWLVLWTAFDGHDDETVWSVRDNGRWSPPAPLNKDNAAPDILPAVIATREGAVAAWSWLDGSDYRLRTAFFDGSNWRLDPPFGGRGSLDARLVATAGTYLLSFQTVVPEEWVALELDEDGRALHRASVAVGEANGRPQVDFQGGGVVFRWVAEETQREVAVAWETAWELER